MLMSMGQDLGTLIQFGSYISKPPIEINKQNKTNKKMKTIAAFALMSLCGAVDLSASQAGEDAPVDVNDARLAA